MPRTTLSRTVLLGGALVLLGLAVFQPPRTDVDLPWLATAFVAVWLLCLTWLMEPSRQGVYRPSAAYLLVFGLFHGGLLVSCALRGPDGSVYDDSWLYEGYTRQAVELAILGMLSYTLATQLAAGKRTNDGQIANPDSRERHAFAVVGIAVQMIGLGIFFAAALRSGNLDLLSGGYLEYIEANQSHEALGYSYLLLGVGPTLAVVAGGKPRVVAWTIFACFAAVALLIGNRGEVLFPLVTMLVVESHRGRSPRKVFTVVGSVAVLMVIGVVRQTRLTGFSGLSSLSSPLDAVSEMGYSLLPTVGVLDWHSTGEPFRNGITLIVAPLRFFETLTGWNGGAPVHDDRLFNVEIADRLGNVGGSPIAEGYHNLGVAGIVILMVSVGIALGWLDRVPRTPQGSALIGIVLLPLLAQIRNSFAPVPVQLAIGLLLLLFVRLSMARGRYKAEPLRAGKT